MTKAEQKIFVMDLTTAIQRDCCEAIDNGKVPESWDGHELRLLLAMRHAESAQMSSARNQRTKRGKDFINTMRVNNL